MHDFLAAGRAGPWLLPGAVVVVIVVLYVLGVARRRERLGRPWSPWRTASFVAGAILLGLALSPVLPWIVGDTASWWDPGNGLGAAGGPAAAVTHVGARTHMAQHVLIGMLAPLGLVLGAPLTLLLGAASPLTRQVVGSVLRARVVRVLGHPATAATLHVGALVALYLTPFYASTRSVPVLGYLVLLHLLAAGCLFTWSIAGPDPAPHRPGVLVRAVVLVVAGGAHGFLAKLLYSRAGELPAGTDHGVAESQAAAQWMFYGGDVAEILLAAALFSWWLRTRRREDRVGGASRGGRGADRVPRR